MSALAHTPAVERLLTRSEVQTLVTDLLAHEAAILAASDSLAELDW